MRPVAVTPGEPAGIGLDLVIDISARPPDRPFVVVADPDLVAARARVLGTPVDLRVWDEGGEAVTPSPGRIEVLPVKAPAGCIPGRADPANAPYVLEALRVAAGGCLENRFSALVTGPVNKGVINDAGIPFTGHTEFLAELAGCPQPVMLLATRGMRVALATTHLPLAKVCEAITTERIESVLRVLLADLRRWFGIPTPRVTVCGLNPHAGESGHLGREEIEIIEPVLARLRREGFLVEGPVPADTAFTPGRLASTDAVLAMYHDQGLPVLKHAGFSEAVNLTLGLPFIRTSVDHGTALDLAGTGTADASSLRFALDTAFALARGSRDALELP